MSDDSSGEGFEDDEADKLDWDAILSREFLSEYVVPSLSGVLLVFFIVTIVVAILGVWPPFFNVVSGSMEPNIEAGSFVVAKDVGRFEEPPAIDTHQNSNVKSFGKTGDVVAYRPNGRSRSSTGRLMVLHRAMFHVEKGENWYQKANPNYLPKGATSCDKLVKCPAPHSGYITKGDANRVYDQVKGISTVVRPSWIHSEVLFVIPLLGHVRILMALLLFFGATAFVFYLMYVIFREIFSLGDKGS